MHGRLLVLFAALVGCKTEEFLPPTVLVVDPYTVDLTVDSPFDELRTEQVRLVNAGQASIDVNDIELRGEYADRLHVDGGYLPLTLAPGEAADVSISLTSTGFGVDTPYFGTVELFAHAEGVGGGGWATGEVLVGSLLRCDVDGDGHVAVDCGGSDCDDDDDLVHPGTDELCDGIDNDCDDEVDEASAIDASLYWPDVDGDGYGDLTSSTLACDAPLGFIWVGEDCDDDAASVNPEAEEVCDGRDNDCDGLIDGPNVIDGLAFYADVDGDGRGDKNAEFAACEEPLGYVPSDDDCDDTNAAISPLASEVCDGLDNNCDAVVDNEAIDGVTLYADLDGDNHGNLNAPSSGCVGGDGLSALSDDCNDADPGVYPGAVERCDGVDENCNGVVDEGATFGDDWFVDADGDTFGNPNTRANGCVRPPNAVFVGLDCDDTRAGVNPDADEVCDGIDQDCNTVIDDNAIDAPDWYSDSDRDGYGSETSVRTQCLAPPNFIATGGDCNDGAASVHPNAKERCDADDTDCDGLIDDNGDCPCEVVAGEDASYSICTFPLPFQAIETVCDLYGYHVVSVGDAEEDATLEAAIDDVLGANARVWLGATDSAQEGTYRWLDNTPFSYTAWAAGNPNDSGSEDCLVSTATGWIDERCTNLFNFICEANP